MVVWPLIHQSFWLHCTPVVFLLLNHTSISNIISKNKGNFTRGRACFSFKTLIQWQMFWDSLVAKLNLDIHKFRFWNMMMNLGHSLPHSPSWHGWESSNTQGIFFAFPAHLRTSFCILNHLISLSKKGPAALLCCLWIVHLGTSPKTLNSTSVVTFDFYIFILNITPEVITMKTNTIPPIPLHFPRTVTCTFFSPVIVCCLQNINSKRNNFTSSELI